MRINEDKFTIIILSFFVLAGIIFGISGLYLCTRNVIANSSWIDTQAQITDIQSRGKHHKVLIRYKYTNAFFDNQTNYHKKSMRTGDTVHIKVNPEDPMDIAFPDHDYIIIIAMLIVCAFLTGGGGFFIHKLKQKPDSATSIPSSPSKPLF